MGYVQGRSTFVRGAKLLSQAKPYYQAGRAMYDWYNQPTKTGRQFPGSRRPFISSNPQSRLRKTGYKYKKNAKTKKVKVVKVKTPVQNCKKEIRDIQKRLKNDEGTFCHREKAIGAVAAAQNASSFIDIGGVTVNDLDTNLQYLQYYDIDNPGVFKVVDGRTGTQHKEFLYSTLGTSIELINNYGAPIKLTLYLMEPKVDTSLAPPATFTNGLIDIGNPSATSVLVYPTDSKQLGDIWKICRTIKKTVMPGQSINESYFQKDIMYDPSFVDTHASTYQKRFGSHTWCVRLQGVDGHDSALPQYGSLVGALDWVLVRKLVVKYQAGTDLYVLKVTDGSDTFTNSGRVSIRPTTQHVTYSAS